MLFSIAFFLFLFSLAFVFPFLLSFIGVDLPAMEISAFMRLVSLLLNVSFASNSSNTVPYNFLFSYSIWRVQLLLKWLIFSDHFNVFFSSTFFTTQRKIKTHNFKITFCDQFGQQINSAAIKIDRKKNEVVCLVGVSD